MMMTIVKERAWASSVEVDAGWKSAGVIARHRPYFYYRHDRLYPCDRMGFRVPTGFSSVAERYEREAADRPRVFCFGGSTTFGVYHDYEKTYPAQLESLTGAAVFNFGLQEMDLHANLYSFIDVLREGMKPDIAVFLDGINEKIGFRGAQRGQDRFVLEHVQYEGFAELARLAGFRAYLRRLMRPFGKQPAASENPVDIDMACRWGRLQAQHYLNTRRCLMEICQGIGVRTHFFLQPTIWDTKPEVEPTRAHYLRTLYDAIIDQAPEVHDLSRGIGIEPDMFYDVCHLDAAGYERLARTIAGKVTPCAA